MLYTKPPQAWLSSGETRGWCGQAGRISTVYLLTCGDVGG